VLDERHGTHEDQHNRRRGAARVGAARSFCVADSALIDEALAALLNRQRAADIDAAYAAYDAQPLDERDAWGDLASFRAAAGGS
jgi:hypothetical protein